jgi:DNA repair exonuclease SbcCD ATPase subunit
MDEELADEVTRGFADAEEELGALRAALDEARAATQAAEEKLRKRQAEESEKLGDYERAYERVRLSIEAERQRLEDAKRSAEEGLRVLDAKLQEFADGPEATVSLEGSPQRTGAIEERLAALLPVEDAVEPPSSTEPYQAAGRTAQDGY